MPRFQFVTLLNHGSFRAIAAAESASACAAAAGAVR